MDQALKPGVLRDTAVGSKPHLPIEPRLVWDVPRRASGYWPRLVAEHVLAPDLAVIRTFDDDLGPRGRCGDEQPISVDDEQRRNRLR